MPQVEVLEVKSVHEKVNQATLKGGKVVKWWKDSAFNASLVDGASVDMKVETKPARNNPDVQETWVVEVNGVGAKARAAGGGGGGFRGAPKSNAEIFSSCIAGIMKSAIEQGWDVKAVTPFLDEFEARMAKLS